MLLFSVNVLYNKLIKHKDFFKTTGIQVLKYRNFFLDHSKDGISLPLSDLLDLSLKHYKIDLNAVTEKLVAPALLTASETRKNDLMFCAISIMRTELNLSSDAIVEALGLVCYAQLSFFEQYLSIKSNQGEHDNVTAIPNEYACKWELDNYGESMYPITSTIIATDIPFSTGLITLYKSGEPNHI